MSRILAEVFWRRFESKFFGLRIIPYSGLRKWAAARFSLSKKETLELLKELQNLGVLQLEKRGVRVRWFDGVKFGRL